MIIKDAKFTISNTDYRKCPEDGRSEYAFIGRSNVGKSSLINMMVNRKNLAMTSSTPGKTMLINHFLINDEWYLVDLPGYGYAKRSKDSRAGFQKMINDYILKRKELKNLFVLIDSRHKPQAIDLEFIAWLGENGIPFAIIFTKIDKLSNRKLNDNIEVYRNELSKSWEELPPVFYSSAEKKIGASEILDYVATINKSVK